MGHALSFDLFLILAAVLPFLLGNRGTALVAPEPHGPTNS